MKDGGIPWPIVLKYLLIISAAWAAGALVAKIVTK